MRLIVKDGFIVAEDVQVQNINVRDEVADSKFLWDIRHGDYDAGERCVDLRRPYRLSTNPYYRFKALSWVNMYAKKYGIERDSSFVDEYEPLLEIYSQAWGKCWEEYTQRMKERAEEIWNEKHKDDEISTACGSCPYCADVIDGDLYCDKYRKWLEVKVGEKVTLTGEHLLFASHGIKLPECMEEKRRLREEAKAKFIDDFVNDDATYMVEREIAVEMRKY